MLQYKKNTGYPPWPCRQFIKDNKLGRGSTPKTKGKPKGKPGKPGKPSSTGKTKKGDQKKLKFKKDKGAPHEKKTSRRGTGAPKTAEPMADESQAMPSKRQRRKGA